MAENFEFKISGRLVRLGSAINRYRNMRSATLDLTSSQLEAISYVIKNSHRDLTAKDLMDYMKLSQSTVAGIIDRLCEKGFIARKRHEADSRKVLIVLTEKGRELDTQLRAIGAETECLMLDGMTEREIAAFDRLLQIVFPI